MSAVQAKSMTTDNNTIDTWANIDDEESAMTDDHYHLWLEMIRQMETPSLHDKKVLDYGCNQGGFLNVLYQHAPYAEAYGVDIAQTSIQHANNHRNTEAPLSYGHIDSLADKQGQFDVAFSHEVLYLLNDLPAHAKLIKESLAENGVYYAAIGCHVDNPMWDHWVKLIGSYSNLVVQDYSLNDYADAFFNEGFKVSARPYQIQGFVPLKQQNEYFPKISDSLHYHSFVKTLFKFEI